MNHHPAMSFRAWLLSCAAGDVLAPASLPSSGVVWQLEFDPKAFAA